MQRIAVLGSGRAGQSTFAIELGRRRGLPVIHLDEHVLATGLGRNPYRAVACAPPAAARCDRWIVDGNYSSTLEMRLNRWGQLLA